MSKNPVYENIVEASTGFNTVRVWFAREIEGPLSTDGLKSLHIALAEVPQDVSQDKLVFARDLAKKLGERVTAVEVRNREGGSIYYPDWR